MTGIIVGIDGSDHSRLALRWALHEAAQRHVPLKVLTVRAPQVRPATGIYWGVPDLAPALDDEADQKSAEEFVAKVASDATEQAPETMVTVTTGDAAAELIKASADADMIVVGSRGSGGFARVVLGSVSSKVVHHATCPVVVIPGIARPRGGSRLSPSGR